MTTVAKREGLSGTPGCGGDGCGSRDPWPLHHVRHRSVYCRLCTSCVLRYHPGAFCSACFDVLDSSSPPDRPLVHCAKCPAVAHLACLPDSTAQYLCPSCSKPHGFSYFAADDPPLPDGRRRAIDLPFAKVLLAAARLATASMTRAIAAARSDAERKVREAALARKRGRDMLERALSLSISISSKEREKKAKKRETSTLAAEPKKKSPRTSDMVPALSSQRTAQDRNRDKWMRFHEPIQVVRPSTAVAHSIVEKGHPVNSIQNHVTPDLKDQASSISHILTNANPEPEESEKEMKGHHPGSQDATGVKEDIRTVEPDNGHRIPQQTQDASVSRMNNGATFAGLPSTASLHS